MGERVIQILSQGCQRHVSFAIGVMLVLASLTSTFPGESGPRTVDLRNDPEIYGIVGLDPWYTYNADPEHYPDDVNRALLERMAADMTRMGARWIRIEFHAEFDTGAGPGSIDYAKHDWFINEAAPRYGLNVLAVLGSGLIGGRNPAWSFERINDPLTESGSNPYIDLYVNRVQDIMTRYGSKLAAVEVLNEPNANEVLSIGSAGTMKSVAPGIYGELLRRTFDAVKISSPTTTVVMGGVLFDDEHGTSYDVRGRSYDMDWLEGVYGSRAVMSYQAEHGRHPFDAIAVHPYFMEPHHIIEYLEEARALQLRFGDRSGRIWITEVGWPAQPADNVNALGLGLPSESEWKQAAFMSAIYTSVQQRAPYVERIFWFKYEDFPTDGQFNGWGLVRLEGRHDQYGSFSTPWPRKFAYSVYQALANPEHLPVAPVDPPAEKEDLRYFEESGHTLAPPFLDFWEEQGGESRFGLPITEPFEQGGRLVQYFERARLEHFPEAADDRWRVQLGHIGRFLVDTQGLDTTPAPVAADSNHRYFPETGHSILGAFRLFWKDNGGLTQFGFPITSEIIEDGVRVQYFERARFEYVPLPDDGGFEVRLGDIGSDVLAIPGWYR
ncbi:hypothetical protein BH23CHL2_BH23CHL2_13770 [soil metagenome]